MRIFLVAAAATLIAACGHPTNDSAGSAAGATVALANGDFEQPADGADIPGWQYTHHAGVDAYTVALDKTSPAQGKASVKMTRTQPQVYGTLSQIVPFKGHDGKTLRLTAKMKSEGVGDKGWKLFVAARGQRGIVYSEPMTGSTPWKDVSIQLKIMPGVDQLEIGATLLDGGTGWIDDVQLRVAD